MKISSLAPIQALVTGATSGIGEAFARSLPANTKLLLTGRNQQSLETLTHDLGHDRVVETISADLSKDAGIDAVSDIAAARNIDLLICNAGVGPYGDFLSAPEDALKRTLLVNAMAPMILARRLLPGMIDRAKATGHRAGVIIVASSAAFVPVPRLAAYAASKSFDLSLTETLAAEVADQPIDVLAVCPTATRSRFAERSGFGDMPPMAQSPQYVARRALWALGRQRTLVLGPVTGSMLTPVSFARAAIAHTLQRVLPQR
jgi:uncharacterized protein